MRAFAYGAITQLSKRVPAVVAADGSLPALLFGALGGEDAGARTSLQEALAALADVHADGGALAASKGATLRPLLLRAAGSASPHERLCAMVWAGRVFRATMCRRGMRACWARATRGRR